MDERAALARIADRLPDAGDDCAVVDGLVLTTDMLHEATDFPAGTTRYTAGWRAVGASLSDVAAMGADATAAVAVYAAPSFDPDELDAFIDGACDVCGAVGADYVGGDLDGHDEFTVATTAIGETDDPVLRSGATPGDSVCVTGTLGRSAAALRLFRGSDGGDGGSGGCSDGGSGGGTDGGGSATAGEADHDLDLDRDVERANDLFRFEPRVAVGRALAPHASAMMDSSDGLARSLHQLADASDCGFAVEYDALPVDEAVTEVATDAADERELAVHFGEDFELVFTTDDPAAARDATPTPVAAIGRVTGSGVEMDGEPLPDRGYTHGD